MSKKIEKPPVVTIELLQKESLSVGVDWLTATVSNRYPREKAQKDYEDLLRAVYPNERPVSRPMKLLGYKGEGRGEVFFGEREDGWMMRVMGGKSTLASVV